MSEVDEKKIEEMLTRLLEGPVGDRFCAKIISQVGMDLSKVLEGYFTKKEYEQKFVETEEGFGAAAQEAIEGLSPMLNELASYSSRLHNLELLKAVEDTGLPLKLDVVLMERVRSRVLTDLQTWVKNKEFHPKARAAMQEYLDHLQPAKPEDAN